MKIGASSVEMLKGRLLTSEQVSSNESLAGLPPYIDSFLAHLRLLVGVPFQYLVPDERLLPKESIRFFYLDRSWTDRLVDGAVAVGKIGTRELAHAQAHVAAVQRTVDDTESMVRDLQRRRTKDFVEKKQDPERPRVEADTITGFLLRSGLVSGWPQMEVRAFARGAQLTTLRLERLSPAVMIALFRGVPDRVELEEPHQGVQFGVDGPPGAYRVFVRRPTGERIPAQGTQAVPMRAGGKNVIHASELRARLHAKPDPAIDQTGPAAFAISVLNPPYRQPFGGSAPTPPTDKVPIKDRVLDEALLTALRLHIGGGHG